MTIRAGHETWMIHPRNECAGQPYAIQFRDRVSVLAWLYRLRSNEAAFAALRRFTAGQTLLQSTRTEEEFLNAAASFLSSGAWHVHRVQRRAIAGATNASSSKRALSGLPTAFLPGLPKTSLPKLPLPSPPKLPSIPTPSLPSVPSFSVPPLPDPATFLPSLDVAAMAKSLLAAAVPGTPFCLECAIHKVLSTIGLES